MDKGGLTAMQRWLAVVSDLHISEGDLDDLDDEMEGHLADFFASPKRHAEPVELVINGDFLDFVQAPPWSGSALGSTTADGIPLRFIQDQSLEKLANIETRRMGDGTLSPQRPCAAIG
jgi:hypothetical protein